MNLKELMERRAKLNDDARAILDAAAKDKRGLTDDERSKHDAMVLEITTLNSDIERVRGQQQRDAELEKSTGRIVPPADPMLGMPESDLKRYSLVRAIRAHADAKTNKNALREAGLELEASAAMAKKLGRDPQGFWVPGDWLKRSFAQQGDQRALSVGPPTAGGNSVQTDLMSQDFIDILRNRMLVRQAGATILTDLVGNLAIPRQTGASTGTWVAEGGNVSSSDQAMDQVTLSPKTFGMFTDYSRRLLNQSSLDIEAFVRNDQALGIALAIDRAALHGPGTGNQPRGIAATAGIGAVVGGANGLAPAWSHIVGLETEVAIDNADISTLAYMTNAKVRGKMKTTQKAAGTDSTMLWQGNTQPVNGYDAYVTNQVASDLTKGTSNGVCSAIFFGNWADLLIGFWSALDVLVDPYVLGQSGGVRVISLQDSDVAVRRAESFAAMLDALTA